jgi:hypothetical protein
MREQKTKMAHDPMKSHRHRGFSQASSLAGSSKRFSLLAHVIILYHRL